MAFLSFNLLYVLRFVINPSLSFAQGAVNNLICKLN